MLEIAAVQATTSGTDFAFTNIPSGTKQIDISFAGVSLSGTDSIIVQLGDSGGASRFFYVAKPSQAERNLHMNESGEDGRNSHPTVKPVELLRHLVRLVTPSNGTVLDPFCGSGTTGLACMAEMFNFIGIEKDEESASIARRRTSMGALFEKNG